MARAIREEIAAAAQQSLQQVQALKRERDEAAMLAQQSESRWKGLLHELETLRAEKDRETARLEEATQRLEQRIESLNASRAADQSEMHGVYRSAFDQQQRPTPSRAAPSGYDGTYASSNVGSSYAGSVRSTVEGRRYGAGHSPARSFASSVDMDSSLRNGYGAAPASSYRAVTPELMEGMPPERRTEAHRGAQRRTRASPGSSHVSGASTQRWTPAAERAPASLRVPEVDSDASGRGQRYE